MSFFTLLLMALSAVIAVVGWADVLGEDAKHTTGRTKALYVVTGLTLVVLGAAGVGYFGYLTIVLTFG